MSYSIEARPYGLLLGLSALAMLSWQTATRRDSRRTFALVVLSLSLVLAVNMQYYGVLLFIPLCAAESIRSLERRRVDLPVLVSIFAGMAGMLIVMPFAKALSPFRAQYLDVKAADYHFITHSYLWLIVGYVTLSRPMQHVIGGSVILLFIALVFGFVHLRSKIPLQLPHSEMVFLFSLSAFPAFGYLLGNSIMHLVEERYILPAIIGITALLAILLAPLLQNKIIDRIILISLFVAIAGAGFLRIRSEKEKGQNTMASLVLASETQHNLEMAAGQQIFTINPGVFQLVGYYSPSADIRSRIALVYSRDEDMATAHNDYISGVAADMRTAGIRNVLPYESVSKPGTEHLFLLYPDSWDWTNTVLVESHAKVTYFGPAFGGEIVSARFPRAINASEHHEAVTPPERSVGQRRISISK